MIGCPPWMTFVQVILDYAKAFDYVNPNILITKLENQDIPDPLLELETSCETVKYIDTM